MKEDKFINDTLIKLRRKYGKEELVSSLEKMLKDKGMYIGILESDLAELKDENDSLKQKIQSYKVELKRYAAPIRESKAYKDLEARNKEYKKQIKKLRETVSTLISKNK